MITPELFTSLIDTYLSEPHASMVNGIVLGRDLQTTQYFQDALKRVGLIHIVVLSGMNITMLSAIFIRLLVPWLGRRIALIATIFLIAGFILFVGPEAPAVRAGIMGCLALVGIIFGRKTLALYILFITSVIMVIIYPPWLTSISFQLSFGATLGILLFGNSPDKQETNETNKLQSFFLYLFDEMRISLAAQVFTVPIIFWYFREISWVAPIANILVAWIIAPLTVLGMITMIIGTINWQVGFVCSWILYVLTEYIIRIVRILAEIPFASMKL
ncbi:MAG: ComEC/Rec2 family competence protein [Weeksellaceae bacterium]